MTHEIRLTIRFTPRTARLLLLVTLITVFPFELGSETLTMTTTYPSPSGIYNTMVTTGQTTLARNGGNVGVGTASPAAKLDVEGTGNVILNAGNVGIGTVSPKAALDMGSAPSGLALPRMTLAQILAIHS